MRSKLIFLFLFLLLIAPAGVSQGHSIAVLSSDNFADMAVASLLADDLKAPLISTPWGVLENQTIDDLKELNISLIYVVGGERAVPSIKRIEERSMKIIKRFNGSDRYETSALVARERKKADLVAFANGYDEEGIVEALNHAKGEMGSLLLLPIDHVPLALVESISQLDPADAFLVPSPDAIQNFLLIDLQALGLNVEVSTPEHRQKTLNLIETGNSTIFLLEMVGVNSGVSDYAQNVSNKLIEESRKDLESSRDFFNKGLFNIAFTQGVRAIFKAEESERIRSGITKIEEPFIDLTKPTVPEQDGILNISKILLDPLTYSEKNVTIQGKVEEAVEIFGTAYVKIFDGTGRIISTFPADRDFMLSRGFIFMADPEIVGQTIEVEGIVHLNVPLGEGDDHGAFAYIIEVDTISLIS